MCESKNIKKVTHGIEQLNFPESSEEEEEEYLEFKQVHNSEQLDKTEAGNEYPSTVMNITINGVDMNMEIDSGAEGNIISYPDYLKLDGIELRPTRTVLRPYNSEPIKCKGMFTTIIKANNVIPP